MSIICLRTWCVYWAQYSTDQYTSVVPGLFYMAYDGGHNDAKFVEISNIFTMKVGFLSFSTSFGGVQREGFFLVVESFWFVSLLFMMKGRSSDKRGPLLSHVMINRQPTTALWRNIVPKKNMSCIVNISDISTKPSPLCSPSSPPSSEPNSCSSSPVLTELVFMTMLFILQLTHSSVRQLKNK